MNLGEPLLRLDSTDSTNRVALEWQDAPHGACVVARTQTAGRGRLGRKWESAPDLGLYFSLILHKDGGLNACNALVAALGVVWALDSLTEGSHGVKWPNDVVRVTARGEARKVGGILCEARGDRLVVGIGVNVNQSREQLPDRPVFPASSLKLETGREWEIDLVLQTLLEQLDAIFERTDWQQMRPYFERYCFGLGEVVRVKTGTETLTGVFDSIGEEGAFILRTADGIKRILAGDVSYF